VPVCTNPLCHFVTPSLAWEKRRKLWNCSHQCVYHFGTVRLEQYAPGHESGHFCHTPSIPGIACVCLASNECTESNIPPLGPRGPCVWRGGMTVQAFFTQQLATACRPTRGQLGRSVTPRQVLENGRKLRKGSHQCVGWSGIMGEAGTGRLEFRLTLTWRGKAGQRERTETRARGACRWPTHVLDKRISEKHTRPSLLKTISTPS
jgi:hypothetical protein